MKSLVKKLLTAAVANDRLWSVLNATWLQAARFAEWERQKLRHAALEQERMAKLREMFPDLTVRHGPFAGMRYPSASAATGSLAPKLMGSYERELHPVLEVLCRQAYTEIVNIGCGEGFYAVGLAQRIPSARIYAVDPDPRALQQCREMAQWNGVADRIVTAATMDSAALEAFSFSGRGLVLCDCEGHELDLFRPKTVRALARHDVLIEVHDFINMEISRVLRERFMATHELAVIPGIDDIKKAQTYDYDELYGLDLPARKQLLAEERPGIMEWFFLTPRAGVE